MPQFIALVRRNYEKYAESDFAPLLEPEAERVRELYAQHVVRQIWSRGDVPGAALLLECAGEPEARDAVGSLPLMRNAMLFLDAIIPLIPYRGFGPRG